MYGDSHPFLHHHHHDEPDIEPQGEQTPGHRGPGRGRGHRRGGGRGPGGFGADDFGGAGGFGPRGRRRRPKGAVREAILSLLAEDPANGYSLMKQIAERAEGEWSPSPGSVYPTLAQLVDEGLINATGTEKGTDYALTDAGRAYVQENAEALAAVWANTTQGSASRAAMRESVTALMGVVHQYRFASTDDQRLRPVEQLDEARRALYRILGE